ncbi:MAG: response regulator [Candidatus Aenigmatarchaeota archaeon]
MIYIAIMSAVSGEDLALVEQRIISAGGNAFLQKPVSTGVVRQMVAYHCPSGRSVLLAEDNGSVRESLVLTLTSKEYRVIACEDGRVALETYEQRASEIGLVLSDLQMPELDGLELLQGIRAFEKKYTNLKV